MEPLGIEPADAFKLAFTDASKTISELKVREWTATNFTVVGLIALATFSQGHARELKQEIIVTVFAVLILAGYIAVMWRCYSNLGAFRDRLKEVVAKWVPDQAKGLLGVVDEGTIETVAWCLVGVAFAFAMLDIWKFFG
jgi:hypothetical protein